MLDLNENTKQIILSLRLKVELIENVRVPSVKDDKSLLELIRIARESRHTEIINLYQEFLRVSNPGQTNVLKLKPDMKRDRDTKPVYRGSQIAPPDSQESSKAKKKKIVYRGQVKWI